MLRASRVHYDQGQFEFLQSEKVSQLFPTTIDIKSLNYPLHDLNVNNMLNLGVTKNKTFSLTI